MLEPFSQAHLPQIIERVSGAPVYRWHVSIACREANPKRCLRDCEW